MIGELPLGTRNRILLIMGGHFQVLLPFGLSGGVKSEVLMMIKKVIRFYIACMPRCWYICCIYIYISLSIYIYIDTYIPDTQNIHFRMATAISWMTNQIMTYMKLDGNGVHFKVDGFRVPVIYSL